MMLPNPNEAKILEINKTLFQFLWNSNTDKVSRKTIIQNIENGGLKMININFFLNALKASWIKRIMDEENQGPWKIRYTKLLEKVGGSLFFEGNCSILHAKKIAPNHNFLNNVLEAWCQINYKTVENVSKQIIWNNSKVLYRNKPIYYRKWRNLGIMFLILKQRNPIHLMK